MKTYRMWACVGVMLVCAGLMRAALAADEAIVPWSEAKQHVGKTCTVEGPVAGAVYLEHIKGKPTFLNVGKDHPDPSRFVIVIWGDDRAKFGESPEKNYVGKTVRVTGKVVLHKDIPQIEIKSPDMLKVVEPN
ncbi:MAG: DNA-binding protein [Planctomycetes bacterium]|nr:DNA-binding protein [Planctomycetota bacterium]